MEKKINIAELLKDCPQGMELDCAIWDSDVKVFFKEVINDDFAYPVVVTIKYNNIEYTKSFTKYGSFNDLPYCKCVIFPKGKTTWEGFVSPCQFNDGDVIFTHTNALKCNLDNNWVSIFKEYRNNRCACHVCLCLSDLELYHDKWEDELLCELCEIEESRLATEEEKQKLFKAIEENGYKWNAETKTLVKLVEPKFKAGSVIIRKKGVRERIHILNVDLEEQGYLTSIKGRIIRFEDQDNYELVPNKFDITTLKPFDKVLARDEPEDKWKPSFWGFYDRSVKSYPYVAAGSIFAQCIPYRGNEYLLGTTDDCNEFYKTWE